MIDIEGLSKRYDRGGDHTPALSEVSLAVEEGEVAVLIGANGAGKSTLIRILSTLLLPDGGRAAVGGLDVVRQARRVRETIGVALQDTTLYPSGRVGQVLKLHARLHGLAPVMASRRRDELVHLMDLGEVVDWRVRRLSGGMRRRLDLSLALIHRPPVLLLDEPTASLDPFSRSRFWREIAAMRDDGSCVLLATQNMDEARWLADRTVALRGGAIDVHGAVATTADEMAVDVHAT